jgi:DNA-binding response OmpR family regulator
VAKAEKVRSLAESDGTEAGMMSGDNYTILLIDDDTDFTNIVRTILEVNGYRVLEANDPQTGLETARVAQPSLILLDVVFYGDTLGFEYCRTLKKDPDTKNIPVIMVTSVGDQFGVDFWPADPDLLPADDFITKPIRRAELIEHINIILEKTKTGGGS